MRALRTPIATLLTFLALVACRREMPPSAARAPRPAATSASIPKNNSLDKLRADLEEIPALGTGINFVDPNDKEQEIWTRYSNGLMIRELKPTDGDVPKLGQTLSIAYTGTLYPSGKEFDKRAADNPLVLRLGSKSLIPGFNLGLSTMKLGSKRRIFIPSDLAYGPAGNPMGGIGPNQPLVFDIELLKIQGEPVSLAPEFVMPQPLGPSLSPSSTTSTAPSDEK